MLSKVTLTVQDCSVHTGAQTTLHVRCSKIVCKPLHSMYSSMQSYTMPGVTYLKISAAKISASGSSASRPVWRLAWKS